MALSVDEEKRLQRLELAVGKLNVAVKNLASKRQLNHILSLIQEQLADVRSEVASLKTQIEALKK